MARIVKLSRIEDGRQQADGTVANGLLARVASVPWEALAMLVAFVSVAYVATVLLSQNSSSTRLLSLQRQPALHLASFNECIGATRVTCVVDGDTIWLDGIKIRIADIDTPEVGSPGCAEELALGRQATQRLIELLNIGPFSLETAGARDEDVYGRKLRVFTRDGKSLGRMLVDEGLAHVWDGSKHSWCA